MQKILFLLAVFIFSTLSLSAFATENDGITIKAEVPFREDSGLTKAEYYLSREKYVEALEEANAVIKRHPSSADAYTYAGLAYDRLGQTEKAMDRFKKALLLNPTHFGANRYLAGLYLADGDIPRALEQMQVLRMACDNAGCPELEELQSDINRAKKKKKSTEEE